MKFELILTTLLGWIILLVTSYGLFFVEGLHFSALWLLQTSLLFSWMLHAVWCRLELNHVDKQSILFPSFGWANRITLFRGFLIILTGGFFLAPPQDNFLIWLPGLFYGVAAILDRLDGYIARKSNQTSILGKELDILFDAFGLLVAPLVAIQMGKIHWSYLLLSCAYYIFQWGISWRRKRNLPIYDILPSQLRRTLAGFQMGFIALVLLPVFKTPQTEICGVAFMLPVLVGFIVDWLVITGFIDGTSTKTHHNFYKLRDTSNRLLQPTLRLFLCTFIFHAIITKTLLDIDVSKWPLNFFSLTAFVGAIMVSLGFLGRLGAALLIILLSIDSAFNSTIWMSNSVIVENSLVNSILIICAIYIALLGTGKFSLWQWDDYWVNRQDGI